MNRQTSLLLTRGTLAILALASACGLRAQVITGAVSGRVVSADGKPLPGARVSFESPALFQPRIMKTDETGQYRAQLLPVGNYKIRVSADACIGKTAENVRVGVGTNNQMDFVLRPIKEQGAMVEVVSNVAAEAKTDDKVATNFSAEELTILPTDKSWDSAASLSPGVTGGGFGLNIRGGSTSGQGHNPDGGGYSQVNYTVDGIDVKNDTGSQGDSAFGVTIYDAMPDSIEDIQVIQSQLNARFGRTNGGAVNVVTKSGSNTFEGTIREFISRASWTANLSHGPVDGDLTQSELNANEGYSRFTDVTFSGPIIKDRLWFFFGTRLQPSVSGTARIGWGTPAVMQQTTNGGSSWTNLPGNWEQYMNHPLTTWGKYADVDSVLINRTGAPANFQNPDLTQSDNGSVIAADTKFQRYQGKLTGMINADNTLTATYLYSKMTSGGYTGERTAPPYTTIYKGFVGDTTTKTSAWTLNWNSALSGTWFLEARISKAEEQTTDVAGITTYPVDVQSTLGTGDPNIQLYSGDDYQSQNWNGRSGYFGNFYTLRSSSSITPNIVGNLSYTLNLKTYQNLFGQHEIDFGVEFFQTEHQYGRERNRNYSVMEGGWIRDPSKSVYDASGFLFPVYYNSDGSSLMPIGDDGLPDGALSLYQQNLYGPSSNIEQYTVGGSKSHNNAAAGWVNDTWTISDQWNLMLGLRYNKFLVHDTNGKTQCDNRIFEPRFQLKFNPDGKNKEVYSFTAAKLASRYSDDFASYFRTNGWTSRIVRGWNGAGYNQRNPGSYQYAVDSSQAASDSQHGVRWVNYDELINLDNYSSVPKLIVALDQTMQTQNLQVPYALEFSLGYTRNFDTGFVKFAVVKRDYRKDWVAFVHQGMYDPSDPTRYLTLVNNPLTGQPFSWSQSQLFINSDQHRDYEDAEVSWSERITQRLTFGGNYTYAVEHGLGGTDGLNYYNYRNEKLKLGLDPSVWGPTNALISRSQMLNMYLSYVVPLGKGNVSASVLGKYYNQGQRSLVGYGNMNVSNPNATLSYKGTQLPVVAVDGNSGQNLNQQYAIYYGAPNAFTNGSDIFALSMKLQAQVPLGRVMLLTEVMIDNPFNRISRSSIYDWNSSYEMGSDGVASTPVSGRPLAQFNRPWGYADNHNYYDGGRTFSFNVGLKF